MNKRRAGYLEHDAGIWLFRQCLEHLLGAWERWRGPQGAEVEPGFFRGVKHGFAFQEQERKGLPGAEHTLREMHVMSHQCGV